MIRAVWLHWLLILVGVPTLMQNCQQCSCDNSPPSIGAITFTPELMRAYPTGGIKLPKFFDEATLEPRFLDTTNPTVTVEVYDQDGDVESVLIAGVAAQSIGSDEYSATLNLADGEHEFLIVATDSLSQTDSSTVSVTIDTVPPVCPVLDPLPSTVHPPDTITGRHPDPSAQIISSVNGGLVRVVYPETNGVFTIPVGLIQDEKNYVSVYAVDASGNRSVADTVMWESAGVE